MLRYLALSFVLVVAGCASTPVNSASPLVTQQSSLRSGAHRNTTCPAWPSGTGLLTDGDFSQAVDQGVGRIQKGTVFAPNWVSAGPRTIDFYGSDNPYWQAPNGVCNVDLDGSPGPGGIRHYLVPTMVGKPYTLTFEMSANASCSPTVKSMIVRANDQFRSYTWDTSNGNDAENGDWLKEVFEFQATSGHTRLLLQSQDPKSGDCGALVAAITLVQN